MGEHADSAPQEGVSKLNYHRHRVLHLERLGVLLQQGRRVVGLAASREARDLKRMLA
jgi:hypothetical protein